MESHLAHMNHSHDAAATAAPATTQDDMAMPMSMADMAMTFFVSSTTPLFADAWSPKKPGQYAATCLFIVFLGFVLRMLLALKPTLESTIWHNEAASYNDFDRAEESALETIIPKSQFEASGPKSPRHRHKEPRFNLVVIRLRWWWRTWRFWPALGRGVFEAVVAGVAYLLMVAVMTMNVGYFLSALLGIFLGTFAHGSPMSSSSSDGTHC